MLNSLAIRNFILIDELELDFKRGFTTITGETGAGKSIILDAILFTFGQKVSRNIIKTGQEKAQTTICFDLNSQILNTLNEYDIQIDDDDEVIIKRSYSSSGKSKFYINDQIVSKKIATEMMDHVIEMHGQHSHSSLLDTKQHLSILDEFAQVADLKNEVSELYLKFRDVEKKIESIEKKRLETESEIEYLEHICAELENLDIKQGEFESLQEIRRSLQFWQKEIERIQTIINNLEQSEFCQIIARAQRSIAQSSDPERFISVESKLEAIYNNIEEVADELREIGNEIMNPEHSFEEIDDRLHLIKELARKHNCQPDDLLSFLSSSIEKLAELKKLMADSSEYKKQYSHLSSEYLEKAKKLTEKRTVAAITLEKIVKAELSSLQMARATFFVEIASKEENFTSDGIDQICFYAATNPGTPPGAINVVASGGELSRLLLALRAALFTSCFNSNNKAKMIIFDEIDVGISGSVADSIGNRLKELSKSTQVLVITHQPQVAGKADSHILVAKKQFEDHTEVNVSEISGDLKSKEIARMISGEEITITGIKAAEELIS